LDAYVAPAAGPPAPPAPELELAARERQVLALLDGGEQHVDALSTAAGLAPGVLLGALLKLELAGLVAQRPGKHFARNV